MRKFIDCVIKTRRVCLLCHKKLYLILDLDHTLLNSTHFEYLTLEELQLLDSPGDVSKGSLFKLEHIRMITKLRPFVHQFLKEASEMFEMYIYTMGARPYALEMAKLLDPQGKYFNAKIISRDDGTQKNQKSLDVVLGKESAILILDDTEHGLRLHDEEISRLHNKDTKSLLCHKKMYLVLDLDCTLLNSTHLDYLTSEELQLLNKLDSLGDISKDSLFKLEHIRMITKLRPFVRPFLKEASEMFEMYIYTMGDRPYALEMAKLLDPQGKYFNAKVISRDDGTQKNQKGLDVVLGQESAVLILDDTKHAWMKHKDNLILMERYHFFSSSCRDFGFNCKSLAELKKDEDETNGALAKFLKVLKKVHCTFFYEHQEDLVDRDVRQVLSTIRKKVLRGCVIVFSCISHETLQSLWKMAEQMGVTCLTETDPSVTHIVATDAGTEKSRWAVKEKKFLVHPRWVEAANFFWQKPSEEDFILKHKHSTC